MSRSFFMKNARLIITPRAKGDNFTQNRHLKSLLRVHMKPCKNDSFRVYLNRKQNFTTEKTIERQADVDSDYIDASDNYTEAVMKRDMKVLFNFISEEDEKSLLEEVEPYLKRLRYESNHWDDAIHSYRETERRNWTQKNNTIIQRVRDTAFPPGVSQLSYVHVLDIKKEGYIKAHVDAVKFCGDTICGISLLSPSVMRLVHTEDKNKFANILLKQRSLYIMKNDARYHYTHEILPVADSKFKDIVVPRDRRISIMCRNEP